jgi:hypothetical protein
MSRCRYNGVEFPCQERKNQPRHQDLWREFHSATLTDSLNPDSLEDFCLRVDIMNLCRCGKTWREIIAAHPLPLTGQFEWGVDRHNEVNAKLGKPIITHEQARCIWSAI